MSQHIAEVEICKKVHWGWTTVYTGTTHTVYNYSGHYWQVLLVRCLNGSLLALWPWMI